MEILAGLVRLDRLDHLPAPWFNRPALGLVTNTAVRVAIVKASKQTSSPPDIIVTPLQTDRLHCTVSITVDLKERTGAIYEILQHVGTEFNIALTETVTIDQRTVHRVTLLLEPPVIDFCDKKIEVEKFGILVEHLKNKLGKVKEYISIDSEFMASDTIEFEKEESSEVERGIVKVPAIRRWIESRYVSRFGADYDFDRVVVSSSTDSRFIRYIFPKKGVFEATISHLDKPGALTQICSVLEKLDYNILLSRLSRSNGGAEQPTPGKSIFVAICEPSGAASVMDEPSSYAAQVAAKISRSLEDLDARFQLDLRNNRVSLGARVADIANPPGSEAAGKSILKKQILAQSELREYFPRYDLSQGPRVFVSYRNHMKESPANLALLNKVFDTIREAKCIVYDGFDEPRPLHDGLTADARARMWLCDAAVFIAIDEEGGAEFGPNQRIELGIAYGQAKRFVAIVRAGHEKKVSDFMVPDHSCIAFKDLENHEIEHVGRELMKRLREWNSQ